VSDHFDRVRDLFNAVNAGDLASIAALYDAAAIAERLLFGNDDPERFEGRDAILTAWRQYLDRYAPGFDGGTHFQVRTIGGIQTGWGWVHAEWLQSVVERATGERHGFAGYSHFLVEEGTIRRQRDARERAVEDPRRPDMTIAAAPRMYPNRPIVGVGAVILSEGKVVLVKRRHEPLAGQWSLPGGTLELGETLEAGVAREMLEETGLVVEVGPVIEVFDRILLDEERKVRYHFVLVDYLCRPVAGTLQSDSDVSDVVLADPLDLSGYHLAPKARDVIARALQLVSKHA
jgi:ADP-ribose pyrophosphatase YjhB (NUDIX family)